MRFYGCYRNNDEEEEDGDRRLVVELAQVKGAISPYRLLIYHAKYQFPVCSLGESICN